MQGNCLVELRIAQNLETWRKGFLKRGSGMIRQFDNSGTDIDALPLKPFPAGNNAACHAGCSRAPSPSRRQAQTLHRAE